MARSFYQRTRYDVFLTIDGAAIPKDWIIGSIKISKTENESTLASFALLHEPGEQNPEDYMGADVTIDIRVASGVYRVFTGIIDVPTCDLINQITSYTCTDDIGFYSEMAFGVAKDQTEELAKRVSTIPYSFDFNNYGNPMLTPWEPKGTPDFELGPSEVYYIEPRVEFTSRIKRVNTVSMSFDYSYQRLHHQGLSYSCTMYTSLVRWWTGGKGTFPTRDMIRSAANGVGWVVDGEIQFTPLWPAQIFSLGSGEGAGVAIWQPNLVKSTYRNRVDSEGNVVNDVNGNPIQEQANVSITDTSSMLCIGTSWASHLRFTQNVTETYNINVVAPQSVGRYGEIVNYENYSASQDFDTSLWEKSQPQQGETGNFYYNRDENRGEVQNAFICVLHKARTTLIAAHRDVQVYFKKFLWPEVDLNHTVFVNTNPLEAIGKVRTITHDINVQTTEAKTSITLTLSRMDGSTSDSALSLPQRPLDPVYVGTPQQKALGMHLGVDVTSESYANANGYFGNWWVSDTQEAFGKKTEFQEAFIVDTPDIPDSLRETREIEAEQDYNVSISNNHLVVRY